MRRTAVATLLLVIAGCTAEQPASPAPDGPGAVESPPPESSRQPLVLVTHLTVPPVRMSLAAARKVLAGSGEWRVVAAPGVPATGAVRVRSTRAVLREVERDPGTLGVLPATGVGPTVRAVVVAGFDPIRDPAFYPLTVPGPVAPRPRTLGLVGDIMLSRGVQDPAGALAPLTPLLRGYDVTVGNLESTLSDDGAPQQGGDSFAARPSVIPLLESAGFDALSLANNHTGDYQDAALLETVRRLQGSSIRPFGAGADLAAAGRAAVVRVGTTSFGFVGFNAIGETPMATREAPGALSVRMPPRTGPLNRDDLAQVARLVQRLDHRVDVVVVMPHWGTQYTHRPEPIQRQVAMRLVSAGADLVVGGHPHWVQGMDRVRRAVVVHSLGNFVFDMDFMTETQQGVVLEATFWGATLKAIALVPYRMDGSFAPHLVDGAEATAILSDIWRTSTGPFRAR
ncbi:MAG TPA: CapA family protein [Nocardioidaceae bacterium]|nr:CapA family protein [Nocardioidaceae bacterium]